MLLTQLSLRNKPLCKLGFSNLHRTAGSQCERYSDFESLVTVSTQLPGPGCYNLFIEPYTTVVGACTPFDGMT